MPVSSSIISRAFTIAFDVTMCLKKRLQSETLVRHVNFYTDNYFLFSFRDEGQ